MKTVMLKRYNVALFGLSLWMSGVLTTDSEDIFAKFQQSDYDLAFEFGEVVSYNKQKLKHFHGIVFKHNRTTTAANLTIQFNFDIGNDLEILVQVYKFASNEFRFFPIRMQVNYCVGLNSNLVGAQSVFNCGNFTRCPFSKGILYHACNWMPQQSKFPPFIPTGRYMLEVQGLYKSTELFVLKAYGSISRPIVKK